jgi:hypothetical protein
MSYKIETISPFRKSAKKLIKKYPSLKNELAELGEELSDNPTLYQIDILHSPIFLFFFVHTSSKNSYVTYCYATIF